MSYARWATREEVAEKLVPVNNGTEFDRGGIPLMFDSKYLYIDQKLSHNLIIGATGSGKTQVSILPTLKLAMFAGESFVVNDPKGELYTKMANKLENEDYCVLAVDFDDSKYGNSWNPFVMAYQLYKKGEKDKTVKLIEDIGYYLFNDPREKSDPFWTNSVIDYFTGLTLYLFENAKEEEININSIFNLSNDINEKKMSREFVDKLNPNSSIYINLVGTLKAPPETRGSILSVFNQKIKKYISRENVCNMLSYSDFDIFDISNNKYAIFIISGYSDYCNNLIPLFVNQIVEGVNYCGKKEKVLHILLDEFDSMIPIKEFSKLIEYSRSLFIRFTIVIKSYKHLSNMYSEEEVELLKMCFGNIIYLLSNDIYTLNEISNYCGNQLDENSVVPLISPEELKTLDMFNAIVIMTRMMPFKTELLPDYKINWFYKTTDCELPLRKEKKINIYSV